DVCSSDLSVAAIIKSYGIVSKLYSVCSDKISPWKKGIPWLRACLNFSHEESTIKIGYPFFTNELAKPTVKGLLPIIKTPGFPSKERFSFLASGPIVKPWATTVKNTRP